MSKPFSIIIAGGKTGGHLFPGIAVAQALERICPDIIILFVGTNTPFETQTLEQYGYPHKSITSKPIKGGTIAAKAISMSIVLVSLIQSMVIMKKVKPDFVIGVGGFSSFAVVLAAWVLGIHTAIQEQNSFPGLTNRLLSRFAGTIFTSFEKTKGFIGNPKVKYVGNPVRKTKRVKSFDHKVLPAISPDRKTILVTGGSQGAKSINTAFMDALELMDEKNKFNIIHQTGVQDESIIRKKYSDLNITATIEPFFHDLPHLMEIADLAITRAGAGTIFELCMKGLPAILVPFPYASDDHQTFNAKALEVQNAAMLINDSELTGKILLKTMDNLLGNNERLNRMAQRVKRMAMPNADEQIAYFILKTKDIKA